MPKISKLSFDLPVSILKEGDVYVAYSPAVEVSTVGETPKLAQQHFEEALKIFFEEIIGNNTFEQALLDLGWQKKNKQFTPPQVISNQIKPFSFEHPESACYA